MVPPPQMKTPSSLPGSKPRRTPEPASPAKTNEELDKTTTTRVHSIAIKVRVNTGKANYPLAHKNPLGQVAVSWGSCLVRESNRSLILLSRSISSRMVSPRHSTTVEGSLDTDNLHTVVTAVDMEVDTLRSR